MQLAFGCVKFLQEELSLNRHEGASKHSGGSNAHKPFPETTLRLSPIPGLLCSRCHRANLLQSRNLLPETRGEGIPSKERQISLLSFASEAQQWDNKD